MLRIVENDGPPIPEGLSDLLVTFLKACFRKIPTERPSANELSQHEWLNGVPNINKVRECEASTAGSATCRK